MRWIIWYIRSMFCKHDFDFLCEYDYYAHGSSRPCKCIEVYMCNKCGFVRKVRA